MSTATVETRIENPPMSGPAPATPAASAPPPSFESEADIERRLLAVSRALLEGLPRSDVTAMAMTHWHVSRRTAQLYIQKAKARLFRDGGEEERAYYLRLSQLQRDQLYRKAMECLDRKDPDASVLHGMAALINAVRGVLDSRDRVAVDLHSTWGKGPRKTADLQAEVREINELARALKHSPILETPTLAEECPDELDDDSLDELREGGGDCAEEYEDELDDETPDEPETYAEPTAQSSIAPTAPRNGNGVAPHAPTAKSAEEQARRQQFDSMFDKIMERALGEMVRNQLSGKPDEIETDAKRISVAGVR